MKTLIHISNHPRHISPQSHQIVTEQVRDRNDSKYELEGCIDDERQFKTAKRPQAPGDATVRKRFFRDNFVVFRHRSKRIAFVESVNFSTCAYMQLFNFRYGHMTTFRHHSGVYISQMPGHRLSRLAKGTPAVSQLFIDVTLVWGKTVFFMLCA